MKQHNYAVDLTKYSQQEREALNEALELVADANNWENIEYVDKSKKFFRFKMIIDPKEINQNNFNSQEKYDAGFYYWTSNSMKDTDYVSIRLEQAIDLLRTIDKTILDNIQISGLVVEKINTNTIKIGCRDIKMVDLKTLLDLKSKYSIPQIDIITQGQRFIIDTVAQTKLNEIIKKKG